MFWLEEVTSRHYHMTSRQEKEQVFYSSHSQRYQNERKKKPFFILIGRQNQSSFDKDRDSFIVIIEMCDAKCIGCWKKRSLRLSEIPAG